MGNQPPPGFIARNVIRGRYLFLDLRPPAKTEFIVTCAGWEECSASYEIQRSEWRFPALEYIVSGTWELSTQAGKWNIGPGAIFVHGPGIPYTLKATSKRGLSKYFVDFAGTQAAGLLGQIGFKGGTPRRIVHGRWLRDLLDQLIEAAHMRPAARKRVSQMLMTLLLERIREDMRTRATQSHALRNYERCRAFLAENYLRTKSLAEAARECAVSAPHLSRLFQRFDTESPKDFLLRLKMNHAGELILRNDLSVKETAAQIGFDDVYHFSRCFKRVHGVAPIYFAKGSGEMKVG
jgi:AraC-like DNA-binding protein